MTQNQSVLQIKHYVALYDFSVKYSYRHCFLYGSLSLNHHWQPLNHVLLSIASHFKTSYARLCLSLTDSHLLENNETGARCSYKMY